MANRVCTKHEVFMQRAAQSPSDVRDHPIRMAKVLFKWLYFTGDATGCVRQGKMEAEQRTELVAAGRALKERLAALETAVEAAEDALQREAQKLPNLTHPQVPLLLLLRSWGPSDQGASTGWQSCLVVA